MAIGFICAQLGPHFTSLIGPRAPKSVPRFITKGIPFWTVSECLDPRSPWYSQITTDPFQPGARVGSRRWQCCQLQVFSALHTSLSYWGKAMLCKYSCCLQLLVSCSAADIFRLHCLQTCTKHTAMFGHGWIAVEANLKSDCCWKATNS
jgi:hypothetical protein